MQCGRLCLYWGDPGETERREAPWLRCVPAGGLNEVEHDCVFDGVTR